tara:strand:- start:324 stop:740 length:417 start_codon:yes stop_codon:yes gene_type:complete
MAKKQTSFADKAAKLGKEAQAVYVKYVKSVKSEKTGQWRFNEQIVRTSKSESLDVALKRMSDAENLTDIDLSEFVNQSKNSEDSDLKVTKVEGQPTDSPEQNIPDQSLSDEKSGSSQDNQDKANRGEDKVLTGQSEEE